MREVLPHPHAPLMPIVSGGRVCGLLRECGDGLDEGRVREIVAQGPVIAEDDALGLVLALDGDGQASAGGLTVLVGVLGGAALASDVEKRLVQPVPLTINRHHDAVPAQVVEEALGLVPIDIVESGGDLDGQVESGEHAGQPERTPEIVIHALVRGGEDLIKGSGGELAEAFSEPINISGDAVTRPSGEALPGHDQCERVLVEQVGQFGDGRCLPVDARVVDGLAKEGNGVVVAERAELDARTGVRWGGPGDDDGADPTERGDDVASK